MTTTCFLLAFPMSHFCPFYHDHVLNRIKSKTRIENVQENESILRNEEKHSVSVAVFFTPPWREKCIEIVTNFAP